jgi:hypothetical protein
VLRGRAAENAAVHARVQRLHAPVEDLGGAGEVADLAHGDAGGVERLGRAARRQDLEPFLDQAACELDETGLVGDRDQSAGRFRTCL